MSGGSRTRLCQLPRKHKPKQFIAFFGDNTVFQNTWARLNGNADMQAPVLFCNNDHRFIVAEQLHELDVLSLNIILEPVG